MNMKKWFSKSLAGTGIWPNAPNYDGPNDAWYSLANPKGGW